jgi:hypothetical protein
MSSDVNQHRRVYLNDHLAGSNSALELLDTLGDEPGLGDWAAHLRDEVSADRRELEKLMDALHIPRGAMRQAAGWLGGRLAELKTRLDDRKGGALHRLELLEALGLGIDGKKALWTALESVSEKQPELRGPDYRHLVQRAVEQRQEVEIRRLAAAADAFGQ